MIVSIDGERIDITHSLAIFIQNLKELGGEANTRDISQRSGLKTWQVNEAFELSAELGLVECIGYDSASRGPGSDPKLYELTGTGRLLTERGVPGKVIALNSTDAKTTEKELHDLREWVNRVEGMASAATKTDVSERFEEFRERLDDVESVEDVRELKDAHEDLESYIYEWHEAAETYLRALRRALEDQGIELEPYFRAVEQNDRRPVEA